MHTYTMVRVYVDPILAKVSILRDHLAQNDIQSQIKNEIASTGLVAGAGVMPDLWPELRVFDADRARAIDLIEEFRTETVAATPWTCPICGESVDGEYDACWSCGEARAMPEEP